MKDTLQRLEEEQDPVARIELLLKLSKGFLNNDLERCESAAFELLLLGKNYDLPLATMHHFLVMGRICYRRANLEAAQDYLSSAEQLAIDIGNLSGQAQSLEAMGILLNKQGHHYEALEVITKGLEIFKTQVDDNSKLGLSYNNIANTYNYLKNTDEAEKYYRMAIEVMDSSDRQHNINLIKGNLGLILYQKEQFHDAIAYISAGLEGFIVQNNIQAQSQAYSHLGNCYLELGEMVKALEHFQKGLKLTRSRDFQTEMSAIYQGLGKLYTKMEGYKDAITNLNKALSIRIEKSYWTEACESYLSLYTLYKTLQNKEEADRHWQKGYDLSVAHGMAYWQNQFLENK